MQKTLFFISDHNQCYLYIYDPAYAFKSPFSYIQAPFRLDFNSNSGTMERKQEIQTHQEIEMAEAHLNGQELNKQTGTMKKKIRRRYYRNKLKLVQSAKKNCESNIVNHILTYLMKERQSELIVKRAILRLNKRPQSTEKIKQYFYNFLKIINLKRQRKYINRKSVLVYFLRDTLAKELPFLVERLSQQNLINIDELCYLYRTCIFYYLRNISSLAILTSRRIEKVAKKIHLNRRNFILQQLQFENRQESASIEE